MSPACAPDADRPNKPTAASINPEPEVLMSLFKWMAPLIVLIAPSATLSECPEGGDQTPTPRPDMPRAACDMAPYDLVPRAEVGHVVDWEELSMFDLSAAAVDALLASSGYDALSPVPYGCRVFRYRYTTQDRGQVVEATAVLGVPANALLPPEPFPYALYLHGTTGYSDPCAPSAMIPDGPSQPALVAALGFVAVAPDYIGMNGMGEPSTTTHGYLVGEQVAIGSWDALRAGKELLEGPLGLLEAKGGNDVVLWGGSQGGHAALFTELYGPYYAPEFPVVAAVAAVPPSTIPPLVEIGLEAFGPPTIALAAAVTTMRAWYGAPDDLYSVFTNEDPYYLADNAEAYVFVEDECNPGEGLDADTVEAIYVQPFIDAVLEGRWDEVEPWTCYFQENSLATSSLAPLRFTPTLMAYAENDDLVVTEPQREDFVQLCKMGYQLEYRECQGAGHSEGALWSLPYQLQWLRDRLAGLEIPPEKLCQVTAPVCCSASPEEVCTP